MITLPWPAAKLSQNARSHWTKVAPKKANAKFDARICAIDAMNRMKPRWRGPIKAAFTQAVFYDPDRRNRDGDNHLGMLKTYFDGFQFAGVIVNDSGFVHRPVKFEVDRDRRVVITIIPIQEKEVL